MLKTGFAVFSFLPSLATCSAGENIESRAVANSCRASWMNCRWIWKKASRQHCLCFSPFQFLFFFHRIFKIHFNLHHLSASIQFHWVKIFEKIKINDDEWLKKKKKKYCSRFFLLSCTRVGVKENLRKKTGKSIFDHK